MRSNTSFGRSERTGIAMLSRWLVLCDAGRVFPDIYIYKKIVDVMRVMNWCDPIERVKRNRIAAEC